MIVRVSSRADVYEGVRRLASELPESVILGTSLTISVGDPDPEAKTGLRGILIITFPLAKLREIREKKLTTLGFLQEFPVTLDTGHKLNRRR
jgi:hypothetical protein